MLNDIVLSDADEELLKLLSCDLSEEQIAERMNLTLGEFTLLIKNYHRKFGTSTLHGLALTLVVFGGKGSYYILSHRAKTDPRVDPSYNTTL